MHRTVLILPALLFVMTFDVMAAAEFLPAGAETEMVTVTLRKEGSCSGKMTLMDRAGNELAFCGLDCQEKAVTVKAGTWLHIRSVPVTGCAGGTTGHRGLTGYHPGNWEEFRADTSGQVASRFTTARFTWSWYSFSGGIDYRGNH